MHSMGKAWDGIDGVCYDKPSQGARGYRFHGHASMWDRNGAGRSSQRSEGKGIEEVRSPTSAGGAPNSGSEDTIFHRQALAIQPSNHNQDPMSLPTPINGDDLDPHGCKKSSRSA